PEPPAPEPPVPEPAQAVAASARARTVPRAAPRPATGDLELPAWLRGWDPTIPLTALMVLGLVLAGVVAAVHRTASGGSGAATIQSAQTPGDGQQAANPAGDQKLAQTLVLDQNDFPDGWTFEPHVHDQADVEVVMQQGRVEGLTFFLSFNGRFPPDVEQTLVTRFAHKLANA